MALACGGDAVLSCVRIDRFPQRHDCLFASCCLNPRVSNPTHKTHTHTDTGKRTTTTTSITRKHGTPASSRDIFGFFRGRQVVPFPPTQQASSSSLPLISFHPCVIYTEDRGTVDELYDEDADEEDQKWVNKHWRQGQALLSQQGNAAAAAPSTDAVLNCPCCFTTVCMDCQR